MGKFYGKKILEGVMAINEVPSLWRKATEKWLEENNPNIETTESASEWLSPNRYTNNYLYYA